MDESRLSSGIELGDTFLGRLYIICIDLIPDEVAAGTQRCKGRTPAAHERIEDDILTKGIELNESVRELDWIGGRVTDPSSGLGRKGPDRAGIFKELFAGDRRLTASRRAFEAALRKYQDVLMDIPEGRVAC